MFALDRRIVLERLFPFIPDKTQLAKLKIDYDFVTHVTCPSDAKKICQIITKHIETYKSAKDCTIIDATGGAGCDTIAFSKCFASVVSIEIDAVKYEYLKNNIDVFDCKNVHVINGNSIEIIQKINNVDIIYVDPPWGGKGYKDQSLVRLTLGDLSIEKLVQSWLDNTMFALKCVVLKLPKNYDIRYLFDTLNSGEQKYKVFMYEVRKLLILIIERDLPDCQ